MNDDPMLTVKEVAAECRVSTMSVYRWIRAGELQAVKLGTHFRVRRSWLDRFIEAGTL